MPMILSVIIMVKTYRLYVVKMNLAAAQFKSWCDMYRLTLNLTKSKVMFFSNKK